ncbi:MAG: arylesterase, partial [Xanthomonadaceae bacterium]|nr:arylesterase [Xanthomonadaceae bacterium]
MRWIVRNILGQAFVLACLLLAIPASGWARNGVLIMGDSLSAAHNIPADKGWVSLLEQRLKREMASAPEITNASISGETSSGALTRLPELLRR